MIFLEWGLEWYSSVSVLRPVILVIYKNTLVDVVLESEVFLFADDVNVIHDTPDGLVSNRH